MSEESTTPDLVELWRSAGYERQTQQVRLVKHACSPKPGDGSVIRL